MAGIPQPVADGGMGRHGELTNLGKVAGQSPLAVDHQKLEKLPHQLVAKLLQGRGWGDVEMQRCGVFGELVRGHRNVDPDAHHQTQALIALPATVAENAGDFGLTDPAIVRPLQPGRIRGRVVLPSLEEKMLQGASHSQTAQEAEAGRVQPRDRSRRGWERRAR